MALPQREYPAHTRSLLGTRFIRPRPTLLGTKRELAEAPAAGFMKTASFLSAGATHNRLSIAAATIASRNTEEGSGTAVICSSPSPDNELPKLDRHSK